LSSRIGLGRTRAPFHGLFPGSIGKFATPLFQKDCQVLAEQTLRVMVYIIYAVYSVQILYCKIEYLDLNMDVHWSAVISDGGKESLLKMKREGLPPGMRAHSFE
jgi:hypothetical protein